MVYLYSVIFAIIGGLVYRWRGSPVSAHPLSEGVFALPYAVAAYHCTDNIYITLAVFLLTFAATLTGHGNAIDMGKSPRGEDETMEWAVKWLHGRIPEYWYDFILMAWLGLLKTLPAGIATLNPFLAASGVLKAPAYAVGHIFKRNHTEIAEFLTGFMLWGCMAINFFYPF